jgi:UDP-2-acetamido-2,6-beta-L-arabino-hexul-4-ose reductase
MRLAVTGSRGFIGANMVARLRERSGTEVVQLHRGAAELPLDGIDAVVHLAGVNRPPDPSGFAEGNAAFTAGLADRLRATGRAVPVIMSSSTQAAIENPYGASKRAAEDALRAYACDTGADVRIYRLTNVFGKWARPNYNSAVATFCHNIVHGLPITVHDPSAPLRLVYIDDVCDAFFRDIDEFAAGMRGDGSFREAGPVYETTVGAVATTIAGFPRSRSEATVDRVGTGLCRALYATYLSHIPPNEFAYRPVRHVDPRGEFAEIVRSADSGQVSYFTAHPGVTRGGHYHHTKNEKFLVLRGRARFRFRDMRSGATHELEVAGSDPTVVETVPGWAHDITNIGDDEMLVMLWANETFDRERPDTIATRLGS